LIRVPGAAAGRIEPDNIALFAAIINILIEGADTGGEIKEKYPALCNEGQKKIILLEGISTTPAIDENKGGCPC